MKFTTKLLICSNLLLMPVVGQAYTSHCGRGYDVHLQLDCVSRQNSKFYVYADHVERVVGERESELPLTLLIGDLSFSESGYLAMIDAIPFNAIGSSSTADDSLQLIRSSLSMDGIDGAPAELRLTRDIADYNYAISSEGENVSVGKCVVNPISYDKRPQP